MANPYKSLQMKMQSQSKMIRANEKSLSRARLQMQCACAHRDGNGAISLDSPQGGPNAQRSNITGGPLYTCRECHKKIDLSTLPQMDFDQTLDRINRICDVGKIRMDIATDRDRDLLNRVATFQFEANTLLPDLYNAMSKGNKGKKKQRSPYANSIRIVR